MPPKSQTRGGDDSKRGARRGRGSGNPTNSTNPPPVNTNQSSTSRTSGRRGQHSAVQAPPPLLVNRRQGYSLSNSTLPTQRQPANPAEQALRVEALRNQLRHPYAFNDTMLRRILDRAEWDVNRAAEHFRAYNNEHIWPSLDFPLAGRRGSTVESSRLLALEDAANDARATDAIRTDDAQDAGTEPPRILATTNVQLVELFRRNRWMPQAVQTEVAQRNGDYDDITDNLASLRITPVSIAERDERLALFITITSTDSWYSARVLLESVGWDIARAVDTWISQGGVPVVAVPYRVNNRGRRETEVDNDGMRAISANEPAVGCDRDDLDPDSNAGWSVENGSTSSLEDQSLTATVGTGYQPNSSVTGARGGYLIDEDRNPAHLNCPDASKLRIEVIRGQEYKIVYFSGQHKVNGQEMDFRWDDEDDLDHSNETEFDWSNPAHITKLNRWREEYIRRLSGELVRSATVPYNKYELDWLREREAMRYEQEFFRLASQNPSHTSITNQDRWNAAQERFAQLTQSLPLPMTRAELQQLATDFNVTFAGKTQYQKVTVYRDSAGKYREIKTIKRFGRPRPTRTWQSLQTQRSRMATLCRHFMWTLKSARSGDLDADGFKSDTDSDVEGAKKAEAETAKTTADAAKQTDQDGRRPLEAAGKEDQRQTKRPRAQNHLPEPETEPAESEEDDSSVSSDFEL